MTHRRSFIRSVGGALGAAAARPLVALDELWAETRPTLEAMRSGFDPASDGIAARLADEYLLAPDVVYLNHASIGTVPRVVHEAHKAYLAVCETNPWLYMWGGAWEAPREAVRAKVAAALGCAPADVAITHNTTEGFNLLARGLPLGPGDEVLFSSLNHDGASVCFERDAAARGYRVRRFRFPVERVPELTAEEVVALHTAEIRPGTRLLVLPHVDNIVGLRHPIAELTRAARARGVTWVAADGAQTAGALPLEVAASGIDFYAASPHKWLQAPKGLGLFYARPEAREALRPLWVTWGQDRWSGSIRRFEDYGTRNLPELLALGDACDFHGAIGYGAKDQRLRYLFERMAAWTATTPGLTWRSPRSWSLAGPLSAVGCEELEAPELARRLADSGTNYVFRTFHSSELDHLRLSPNLATTEAELERFFDDAARALRGPGRPNPMGPR